MATHSVLLPGKFRGRKSLADYSPWGCKELDTTERLNNTIASIRANLPSSVFFVIFMEMTPPTKSNSSIKILDCVPHVSGEIQLKYGIYRLIRRTDISIILKCDHLKKVMSLHVFKLPFMSFRRVLHFSL